MRCSAKLFLVLLPFLFAACGSDTAPAQRGPNPTSASDRYGPLRAGAGNFGQDSAALAGALLGTWETVEVDVLFESYGNQDTSFRQTIREADWGKVYGVRPARTEFTSDGKHKRTHRLVSGQVADVTNGLWKIQGRDSLLIIEPNRTMYYAHELEGDRLVLTGTVDYDFDGEADDDYRSVLRLVSKTR